jgi:hypothetical protein
MIAWIAWLERWFRMWGLLPPLPKSHAVYRREPDTDLPESHRYHA